MIDLENISNDPGVYYLFLPKLNVGYVGESNSLKRRVSQHLNSINGKSFIRKYHQKNKDTELTVLAVTKNLSTNQRKELEKEYKQYFEYEGVNLINKLSSSKIENEWFSDRKQILQFDLKGNLIQEYDSLYQAAQVNNFDVSSIVKACKGKINSSKGYIWIYKEEFSSDLLEEKLTGYIKGQIAKNSAGTTNLKHENLYKPVLQFDLSGEFIKEWKSLKEAECCGVTNATGISMACRGRLKTSGGYIWRYKLCSITSTLHD